MKIKPRCIVVDHSYKDVSAAESFGEIVHLFKRNYGRASVWTPKFREELAEAFEKIQFDPENDYLVQVGQQVPLAITIGLLVAKYGQVNMLAYYPPDGEYISIKIGEISNAQSSFGAL